MDILNFDSTKNEPIKNKIANNSKVKSKYKVDLITNSDSNYLSTLKMKLYNLNLKTKIFF